MVLFAFLRAPHDAAYCLLTHHWQVHEIIFPPYLAYIWRNCIGMDVNNLESILVQVMTCHRQTAYSNELKQTEQDILNPSAQILVIWLFYYSPTPTPHPTPPHPKLIYRLNSKPQMWPSDLTLAMTLTLNFQGQIWNSLYLNLKWSDCHETKSKHVDWTLSLKCDHQIWPWPWPWQWI